MTTPLPPSDCITCSGQCPECGRDLAASELATGKFWGTTDALTIQSLLAERDRLSRLAACPPVVTRELARAREGRDKAEAEVERLRAALRSAEGGCTRLLAERDAALAERDAAKRIGAEQTIAAMRAIAERDDQRRIVEEGVRLFGNGIEGLDPYLIVNLRVDGFNYHSWMRGAKARAKEGK
jgi:hypothetical protein